MKKYLLLVAALLASTPAFAQNVSNYKTQGGALWTVGGTLQIPSGGLVQFDSGSSLTLADAVSFATFGATLVQAGASATAGSMRVYPTTAASGYLKLDALDNAGNFVSTIRNSDIGQATVYSLPDAGAATAQFVLNAGAQTIGGAKTLSGALTLDDGTTASPDFIMKDATDETATFSKVDAGFLTITTGAGDGVQVTTGNLKVGNGTPDTAQDGEDAYVEGTFEVDGALNLDGAVDIAGALTANGDVTGDGGDQLSGYLQAQVASTTVGITAAQCGSTFVSNSADVMTLPEASTVLGCRVTFVCGTADDFDINPADGTDVIGGFGSITGTNTTTTIAPAAGDAVRCTDIGSTVSLEAVGANLWVAIGQGVGTWTDVD